MERLKGLWANFSTTHLWRAWSRYSEARGGLLAGGVTYFAFFSLFPVIALAFTVFGLVLRDRPALLGQIREAIDKQLPGFVQSADGSSGLIPVSIPTGSTLGITAVIGVLGLLWAGLGWLSALRDGIRAVFGVPGSPGNFVMAKVRDLGVLVLLGVGVVGAALVSGVANAGAAAVADVIGLGNQGWIVTLVGLLAAVAANAAMVALMLRVLSGVDLPWTGLRNGAVFGGLALTLLQTFGTRLIAGTMDNKLFAPIALVVGLLAFLNFIARAMLLSAAWAANDADFAAGTAGEQENARGAGTAGAEAIAPGVPGVDAAARLAVGLPTVGAAATDRVSLLSGAVLGAAAATLVGTSLAAARRLVARR